VQARVAAGTDGSEVGEHIRTAVRDRDDVIDFGAVPSAELAAVPVTVKDSCSHFPPGPRGPVAGLVVGRQEPSLRGPQERQGFSTRLSSREPQPEPYPAQDSLGLGIATAPSDPADDFQALRLMVEAIPDPHSGKPIAQLRGMSEMDLIAAHGEIASESGSYSTTEDCAAVTKHP